MQNYETSWEDEENNRIVDLSVDYSVAGDSIEVNKIAPKKVTFLCSETKQPQRSVQVYGDRARRHLEGRFRQGNRLELLEIELLRNAAVQA